MTDDLPDPLLDELRSQMRGFTASVLPRPGLVARVERGVHRRRTRALSVGAAVVAVGAVAGVAVAGSGSAASSNGQYGAGGDGFTPLGKGELSGRRTLAWSPLGPEDVELGSSPFALAAAERADYALVARAEVLVTSRCMAAQGFYADATLPEPDPDEIDVLVEGGAYGLRPLADAEAHGYFVWDTTGDRAPRMRKSGTERAYDALSEERKAQWDAAMSGGDEGNVSHAFRNGAVLGYNTSGCLGQGREQVEGSHGVNEEAYSNVRSLGNDLSDAVRADPNFRAAERRWSSCMVQAGHNASRLQGWAEQPGAGWSSRAAEVAEATADARCEVTSGLWSVAEQLQQSGIQLLTSRYPEVFAALDAQQTLATANAKAALATG